MLIMTNNYVKERVYATLYGMNKNGSIKQWNIAVESEQDGSAVIITTHGLRDGRKQETKKRIKKGKNIGKVNETSPLEQAHADALSMWKKKWDSDYRDNIDALNDLPVLPMLAHKYSDHQAKVSWPAYSQPKLNGARCLAVLEEGKFVFTSRKGKAFTTLEHIAADLQHSNFNEPLLGANKLRKLVLDGELFHPDLDFQEVIKRVKREKTGREDIDHTLLEYHIYDVYFPYHPKLAYHSRLEYINHRLSGKEEFIREVPTRMIGNHEEMMKAHKEWTRRGYEGSMIRNGHGVYEPNFRSYSLLKHKDFQDKEFKIVGAEEGTGKDSGTVIWICHTEEGKEFKVRPRGTHEQRSDWWQNRARHIGESLTVRFQERSQDNVPIFPVGLAIRDFE